MASFPSASRNGAAAGAAVLAEEPGPPRGTPRERLDELFRAHSGFVARLVLRLIGRDDEVDDIVQDVFVILFRQLDTMRRPEAVRAWLLTTTARIARRRLRLRRFGFLLRAGDRVDAEELEAQSPSAGDRLALRAMHRVLARMPVNTRIAWVLRYVEQRGVDEVAQALGCSEATAKRRVAKAQRAMKKAMSR